MTPQIFRGRNANEARRTAIETLGADAVIVMTRRVSKGGMAGVLGGHEIEIAALPAERDESPAPRTPPPRDPLLPFAASAYASPTTNHNEVDLERLRAELRNEIRAVRSVVTRAPSANSELAAEVAMVREAVERLTSASATQATRHPRTKGDIVATLLAQRGIEGTAAAAIVRALRGKKVDAATLDEAMRDALAGLVAAVAWPLASSKPQIIAVVGPSGVGKTTTCAKLAAHAVRDGRTVTLVACDAFRVGAVGQLERYAELLHAGFEIAATEAEVEQAVRSAKTDVVLVDTAGQPRAGAGSPEAFLARAGEGGRDRHVLLCLPASLRAVDAPRVVRAFTTGDPTAIAITKIDETDAPGGLLHGTAASRLPVSVLCTGPRVPEDIAPATRGKMVEHLLGAGARR